MSENLDEAVYYGPCDKCGCVHGGWEPCPSAGEVMQNDMTALLRALDLGDHARPYSAHRVMTDEIIPTCEALMRGIRITWLLRHWYTTHGALSLIEAVTTPEFDAVLTAIAAVGSQPAQSEATR